MKTLGLGSMHASPIVETIDLTISVNISRAFIGQHLPLDDFSADLNVVTRSGSPQTPDFLPQVFMGAEE
jgi:hypothetical protein